MGHTWQYRIIITAPQEAEIRRSFKASLGWKNPISKISWGSNPNADQKKNYQMQARKISWA
jgi:hypothetical protein